MRPLPIGVAALAATLALAAPTVAAPRANTLVGTVGPGFTISMNKKSVKPGVYTVTIHDRSSIHDFHLSGPGGVSRKTSVAGVGTKTWTVRLSRGTYRFVCDPHHTIMHGILRVTRTGAAGS